MQVLALITMAARFAAGSGHTYSDSEHPVSSVVPTTDHSCPLAGCPNGKFEAGQDVYLHASRSFATGWLWSWVCADCWLQTYSGKNLSCMCPSGQNRTEKHFGRKPILPNGWVMRDATTAEVYGWYTLTHGNLDIFPGTTIYIDTNDNTFRLNEPKYTTCDLGICGGRGYTTEKATLPKAGTRICMTLGEHRCMNLEKRCENPKKGNSCFALRTMKVPGTEEEILNVKIKRCDALIKGKNEELQNCSHFENTTHGAAQVISTLDREQRIRINGERDAIRETQRNLQTQLRELKTKLRLHADEQKMCDH